MYLNYYKYGNLRGENSLFQIHSKVFFTLISSWYHSGSILLYLFVKEIVTGLLSAAVLRRRSPDFCHPAPGFESPRGAQSNPGGHASVLCHTRRSMSLLP